VNDGLALLLTVFLLLGNGFFVGAEFAIITARRDRLEQLARQGQSRARTVIRAGQQLPLLIAGASWRDRVLAGAGRAGRADGGQPVGDAAGAAGRAGRGGARHRAGGGAAGGFLLPHGDRRDGAEEPDHRRPGAGGAVAGARALRVLPG